MQCNRRIRNRDEVSGVAMLAMKAKPNALTHADERVRWFGKASL